MKNNKIAIIITCHNRAHSTIRCLEALSKQILHPHLIVDIFLVDDGCTDNTRPVVKRDYPEVHIIDGNGELYWNRGMHLGFSTACQGSYDFYLWLNDDAHLYQTAISEIYHTHLELQKIYRDCIVVGSVQDPHSHELVYGGLRRKGFMPLNFKKLVPADKPRKCDTMAGTCVFIPSAVVAKIGLNDPMFRHYMGDIDYGLKATSSGYTIWIAPDFVGTCAKNSKDGTWEDASMPIPERIRKLRSIKGLYPPDWLLYIKRHTGFFWPYYWICPYIKIFITAFRHFSVNSAKIKKL